MLNPVRLVDPDGRAPFSIHTDEDGNVIATYDDNDYNVYQHGNGTTKSEIDKTHGPSNTSAGGKRVDASVDIRYDKTIKVGDKIEETGRNGARKYNRLLRVIDGVEIFRKDIDWDPEANDKYGHWWIEIDGEESYGWWPIYGVDTSDTVFGTEGELNGQTSFRGTPTKDPHHGDRSKGVNEFKVYVEGSYNSDISKAIRDFANNYSGSLSWPFGQNCHSFQESMLEETNLTIRKK